MRDLFKANMVYYRKDNQKTKVGKYEKEKVTKKGCIKRDRKVSFNDNVIVDKTYGNSEYSRKAMTKKGGSLFPASLDEIIRQLDEFKYFEMKVHPNSIDNTLYYRFNQKQREKRLIKKNKFIMQEMLKRITFKENMFNNNKLTGHEFQGYKLVYTQE